MTNEPRLTIDGEVSESQRLTVDDLRSVDARHQIADVGQIDPQRKGRAVRLNGLLERAGAKPTARYLGLHASKDDFHASIPLHPVIDRALLIYEVDGQPLSTKAGGPFRFYIPDHAACHTDEIDECANVKFVDHIELTRDRGYDNRPEDEVAHEQLHREQGER